MFYNELLYLNSNSTHIRFASNFALVKISNLLVAKGLDSEVAITRTQEVFSSEMQKANLYLHNLQHIFSLEIMDKVYSYISHKALFKEPINFSSYDQLLSMMQHTSSLGLSEEELKQLRQVSQANHYSVALIKSA